MSVINNTKTIEEISACRHRELELGKGRTIWRRWSKYRGTIYAMVENAAGIIGNEESTSKGRPKNSSSRRFVTRTIDVVVHEWNKWYAAVEKLSAARKVCAMGVSACPCSLAWLRSSRGKCQCDVMEWCNGSIFGTHIRSVRVQFPLLVSFSLLHFIDRIPSGVTEAKCCVVLCLLHLLLWLFVLSIWVASMAYSVVMNPDEQVTTLYYRSASWLISSLQQNAPRNWQMQQS